ncbi:YceD family protein [Collinsella provencensis]|uniref:YceD family protein n=1 Tax=Collinsella provencensis TaxID=1937461 RepID=UPI000C83043A|nr:DUF177 domain-containing protein [Collinsella provencensis]
MSCFGSIPVDLSERLEDPGDSIQLAGAIEASEYTVGEKTFSLPANPKYDVVLTNAGDGILVTGIVRASVEGECDRCLEPASFEVSGEIEEYFLFEEPENSDAYEDGFELVGEDRVIDLGDAISDAVIMDTPFVVLCQPDCLGLCPTCGANLNEGDCGCSAKAEDAWVESDENPFAALKNLKFDE